MNEWEKKGLSFLILLFGYAGVTYFLTGTSILHSSGIIWYAIIWIVLSIIFISSLQHENYFRMFSLIPFEGRAALAVLGMLYVEYYEMIYMYDAYSDSYRQMNSGLIAIINDVLFTVIICCAITMIIYWMTQVRKEGLWRGLFGRNLLLAFLFHRKAGVRAIFHEIKQYFADFLTMEDYRADTRDKLIWIVVVLFLVLWMMIAVMGVMGIILCCVVAGWIIHLFMRQLHKDYQELLKATTQMALGNMQADLGKGFGLFEPIRVELKKVQCGFQKAVEEATKSERMKTELISNVSHDLKTPLTTMISYLDLLKQEEDEDRRQEYMAILDRSSQRLKVLIEDLFEVSKANSGAIRMEYQTVNLVSLIDQAIFELSTEFEKRSLTVRRHYQEETMMWRLDSEKTYRVFQNILSNAAKYAMAGTRIHVTLERQEEALRIRISNITDLELTYDPNDLTERFVRGDTSRHSEGSGLGLAIAKSFINLQNGELSVGVQDDVFRVDIVLHPQTIMPDMETKEEDWYDPSLDF